LDSFVGRRAEVAEVMALLDDHRLVTLTGVGGVGKTRLALRVAAESIGDFDEGVWLVELATIRDPEGVPTAIASALDIVVPGGEPALDVVMRRLAGEARLLVFDNCEHLLDAVGEGADHLIASCPQVRVLATSREGLAVRGERVWPVPALAESVELFCDRAAEQDPAFSPSIDELEVIAELCNRLDRIPLAVELAARRVRTMSPPTILDRLDQRFRLLRGGRQRAERHQTLRETVGWSYDLLEPAERQVFDRLGVFAGGFDLAAAEAVVADAEIDELDVADHLDSLVSKSLVVVDRTARPVRYRLLETLRQYAAERLVASGEDDALRDRHAGWCCAETARFEKLAGGPGNSMGDAVGEAVAIKAEIDAAVEWLVQTDRAAEAAQLVRNCDLFLQFIFPGAVTRLYARSVEATTTLEPQARATLLAHGCRYARIEGDRQAEQRWGAEALDLVDRLGLEFPPLLVFHQAFPDYDRQLAHMKRALAIAQEREDVRSEMTARLSITDFMRYRPGDEHLVWAEECVAHLRAYGVPVLTSPAEMMLSEALLPFDLGRALDHAGEGVAIAVAAGFGQGKQSSECITAFIHLLEGRRTLAIRHLAQSFEVTEGLTSATVCLVRAAPVTALLCSNADPTRAAEVLGSAEAHWPTPTGGQCFMHRVAEEALTVQMGTEAFRVAMARGAELEPRAALDLAFELVQAQEDPHREPDADGDGHGLTQRQLEVAELVARGLTNRAIAERLGISGYTVETHVRNILERLDATSRTQVASWWLSRQVERTQA
jgi:predicted ATPase/DNA-binding CsgD family transcriptional regulator